MPELSCSLRIGPACSEPVQLADGRIIVACETPARDAIHVIELLLDETRGVLAILRDTLPGGPTDNGTRAQWPRMMAAGDEWVCGYQQGALNAVRRANWGTTFGLSYGVWPIGVADDPTVPAFAWDWKQAPPFTSQGIFGYFADRWWTYDEMRESVYQQDWLALGTLSHAWTDWRVDFYVFKHDSGTLMRTQSLIGGSQVWKVFSGHSEYPRGCTLADGRELVTAVGPRTREVSPGVWEHQLRVAVSPFDPFQEEEPMATISVNDWGPILNLVAPAHVSALVRTSDDVSRVFKRIRPVGQSEWIEESVLVGSTAALHIFRVNDPGSYEFQFALPGGPETSIRLFTVLAPRVPEPPPSQVVSRLDDAELILLHERAADDVDVTRHYYNARCAGLDHRAALSAYRDAVSAAIAQLEVG